jgi:hypothetical protein
MPNTAYLACSAGQPAQISIKGLTLDGMLDDTGEFRILQLLPSTKPGELTSANFVHRCFVQSFSSLLSPMANPPNLP